MLHVFDPHSPFEPYKPYESKFMSTDEVEAFRGDREKALEGEEDPFMVRQLLPTLEALDKAGVEVDQYVEREKDWYDALILAMDVEIGRLLERLEQFGLADKVVIAFMSDHGEEFLEHGKHFHDKEHGEWYGYLHRDGRVSTPMKGNHYKGPFHLPRMQTYCWQLLEDHLS